MLVCTSVYHLPGPDVSAWPQASALTMPTTSNSHQVITHVISLLYDCACILHKAMKTAR